MAEYVTAKEVAKYCQIYSPEGDLAVWGENIEHPTEETITDLIEVAEETIQDKCSNAWGSNFIQITDEVHDFWRDWLEASVHFKFANVMPLTKDTDKLEVFNGSAFVDWLQTKTEGRGEDFYVDYNLGKLFFIKSIPESRRQAVRLSYRYNGGSIVPKAIKISTAFQVGIFLANGEFADVLFPTGEGERNQASSRMTRWEKQIEDFIKHHRIGTLVIDQSFIPVRYY